MVMLNPNYSKKLNKLSQYASFKEATLQTENLYCEQKPLILRCVFLPIDTLIKA